MVLSAVMTFINLGDVRFPSSAFYWKEDQAVTMDFGQIMPFQGVIYLNGDMNDQGFSVLFWNESEETWELCHEESAEKAFCWTGFALDITTRFIMIISDTPNLSVIEMSFLSNGSYVVPANFDTGESPALFDEQKYIPEYAYSQNCMYFDETVHALTAYDFINGRFPTERTHPPLGSSIIALGIKLFGMSPFGWRFICALFGVIIVMPLYALAKLMFGSRRLAFLAAFVFIFDFMRFVQSRVATLEITLVTFIVCMFLFMFKYIQTSPEDRLSRKALLNLGCSGAFMGLAASVKWSGLFAGFGLGVIFAFTWFEARAHYAGLHNEGKSDVNEYKKDLTRTVKWCLLFFGVVPIVIYCLSYIQFANAAGRSWPESIIKGQAEIFNVQTNLTLTHDDQSRWWTWPLDLQPIKFCMTVLSDGISGGISTFGNPVLWWSGFLALIWCVKRWFKDKDKTARFLCIAWFAQVLPWAFISRMTFIYHYFPCVPFLALMTVHFIKTRPEPRRWWYALAYGALALTVFFVFYPVLSGVPVSSPDYIKWLQWLPGWQFAN